MITLFLGGFLTAQEQASDSRTLTVDEAVDYALQNSKTLQSAVIDLQMKERAKNTAWNIFIPSVQLTGTMSRSNEISDPMAGLRELIPSMGSASEPTESDHWNAIGGISASLNLSLALLDGIKVTKQITKQDLLLGNKPKKKLN